LLPDFILLTNIITAFINQNIRSHLVMKINLALNLLLLSTSMALAACAPVQPWERGNLAKPQMELELDPFQSAVSQHNYSSREAASAANNAQGGGCGCN
jgi:hypothetical protein